MDIRNWQQDIRNNAHLFRRFPQIQSMDRAVTTLCEIIMNDLNERLKDAGKQAIPTTATLNYEDAATGKHTQLGIYSTIQFLLGDEILSHGKIDGKPLTKDSLDKVATMHACAYA